MSINNSHTVSCIKIANTLDQGFRRAPMVDGKPSDSFVEYLKILFNEEEAKIVQYVNVFPNFLTSLQISDSSGMEHEKADTILKKLNKKGCLLSFGNIFCLPIITILLNITSGFSTEKFDTEKAADLYNDFFVKEKFYLYYQMSEEGTPTLRTIPVEETIAPGEKILKSEGAYDLIKNLNHNDLCLVPCPCRTRKEDIDERECSGKFPVGSCIMLGPSALHFKKTGIGKPISKREAITYFDKMTTLGLVGTTDNIECGNSVICLCCGCCCSHLRGRTLWDTKAILPSNFIPYTDEQCKYCGICSKTCLVDAIAVDAKLKTFAVDHDKCLGCGICILSCKSKALKLRRLERATMFKSQDNFYKTIASENKRVYL